VIEAASSAHAQLLGPNFEITSQRYEAEASKLRALPAQQYDFNKALLGDVLRYLATDAGISFFSLPDDSKESSRLITFSIKSSPFQVLETLCKANGLTVIPDNGIWYIRPAEDRELIGKAYMIQNNALERVESVSSGGLTLSPVGGGGAAGGGGGGGGIDLQGVQKTFAVSRSEIINDIRALLGLQPEEVELQAAGGAAGGIGGAGGGGLGLPGGGDAADAMNSNELSAFRTPKVIWKSDSNTLYIVATRLQHMWVEGYLEAADKPQEMIAIEVKFIETSRDPSRELGIDWTGTLGQGGTFRQVQSSSVSTDDSGNPTLDVEYSVSPTNGGYRVDASELLGAGNLGNLAGTFGWPGLSLLSAQDLNVKLRALLRDEETKTVSYPRMITLNNREVAIRSVVNQPVLDATASATVGAGATTTTQIAYLPIGTVLNILPKRMKADNVLLNMSVTVSSIIGNEIIGGNPYPIASSRVYNAPVEVPSGYTVAVGGLDEAREREGKAGVPFLQKIPLLGKAFKFDSKSKNHKNLMLFITPMLIDARDGGLPPEPQSVIPQRPHHTLPKIPQVHAGTGGLIGGVEALPNAVDYMEREYAVLYNTIEESRITDEESRKLRELRTAVEQLHAQAEGLKIAEPNRWHEIEPHQRNLQDLLARLTELARYLFSKKYF
jgi:hypothetical protein